MELEVFTHMIKKKVDLADLVDLLLNSFNSKSAPRIRKNFDKATRLELTKAFKKNPNWSKDYRIKLSKKLGINKQ